MTGPADAAATTGDGVNDISETWNPVTGCTKVSEGCDTVVLHPDRLDKPFRWRKPRTVFVNSMSDLFHDDVPDEFITRVFAIMGLTRRHTFQVLTKRPGRMASLLGRGGFRSWVETEAEHLVQDDSTPLSLQRRRSFYRTLNSWYPITRWPLPNVWLGTSVETQKWADVRIPKLLQTPAAVRFLSCEPLLGPIDLTRWIGGHDAKDDANVIDRGGSPARPTVRRGEGDRDSGSEAGCSEAAPERPDREGQDSGPHHQGDREGGGDHQRPRGADSMEKPGTDWVIVGGESGPGARPMHPDWARSLRDQCVAAGVSFFFKQWGEWMPVGPQYGEGAQPFARDAGSWGCTDDDHEVSQEAIYEAAFHEIEGREITCIESDGYRNDSTQPNDPRTWLMVRLGKKRAGRELDGRTWDEMPERGA